MIPPWFQACIYMLEEVCYMRASFPAIYFFNDSLIMDTVFISHHLLWPFTVMTSDLCLIRENLKGMFL